MTVSLDDVKNRIETDLPDSTLTTILNAEVEALNRHAGAATDTETHLAKGARKLILHRRPAAVTSVTERRTLEDDAVSLDEDDDWRFIGDRIMYRLGDGTNPAADWGAEVVVAYTADTDDNLRDRIVLDLVQLSVEFRAFEREVDGDWEGFQEEYDRRRRQIMDQLNEPRSLLV